MTGRELSFRSQLEEARRAGDQEGQESRRAGGQGGHDAKKAGGLEARMAGGHESRYVSTVCTGLLARTLPLLPFFLTPTYSTCL